MGPWPRDGVVMAKRDFRNLLDGFKQGAIEWSRGRYGTDQLSAAITNLAVLLVIVNVMTGVRWVSFIALVLLAYAWFRITSKNVQARHAENDRARQVAGPALVWLANPVSAAREARAYKHLRCPSCGQRVRIPRGKGKVRVTCPKCHGRFEGRA